MKYKFWILAISICSITAKGQDVDTLSNINITATRVNQNNNLTGRDIVVLSGKTFEKLSSISIDDILKFTGGVEVQQRGPAGSQADIIIRGGTFQQVLVLLDGMKINDPITGHFSGYIPIPIAEIERIEIVKGPAAAMYGSEAVGGVINIISKTFYHYNTTSKEESNLGVSFGEYELHSSRASAYVTRKKINFFLGGSTDNSSGQLLRGDNRGYFHNHLISGSASIPLSKKWMLQFRTSYDYRDFAAQNFYTPELIDTATEKVNTWWNQLRIETNRNHSKDQLDIIFKKTNDFYLYYPLSTANNNQSILSQLNYLHTHTFNKNLTGLIGSSYERREMISNDRGNHQNNNGALFASALMSFKKLNISPQIRLVLDEQYKFDALPQLNVSYIFKDITFRASIGKSIRSADFTELYNNYNKPIVKGGKIGNPELIPEKSMNYEIGLDYSINNFTFNSSYFYRKQDQMIDFVNTNSDNIKTSNNLLPNKVYQYAQNIKWVNTSGVEFNLKHIIDINKNNRFSFIENLQMIHSSTSDSIPSYYILSHANFMAQQIVMWENTKFNLSIESVYKERSADKNSSIDAKKTNTYWLVNSKIQFKFNTVTLSININNVGDVNYCDLLGSKMPNRWYSVGINAKL